MLKSEICRVDICRCAIDPGLPEPIEIVEMQNKPRLRHVNGGVNAVGSKLGENQFASVFGRSVRSRKRSRREYRTWLRSGDVLDLGNRCRVALRGASGSSFRIVGRSKRGKTRIFRVSFAPTLFKQASSSKTASILGYASKISLSRGKRPAGCKMWAIWHNSASNKSATMQTDGDVSGTRGRLTTFVVARGDQSKADAPRRNRPG